MQVKALGRFIEKSKPRYGALICHRNSDPDAIFSAYVLSKLFKRLHSSLKCDIVAVDGPSQVSKLLMSVTPVKWVDKLRLDKVDFVTLVDTSTLDQLGEIGKEVERSGKTLIIVDHHTPKDKTLTLSKVRIIDKEAKSTCELVYELCTQLGYRLSRREALALFFGIAYETRHFHIANAKTFRIVADLAASGFDVTEALDLMTQPMSLSERVARLKAASRVELHNIHGWILAFSHVNSHEASAARGLITLGADVSVVVGEKEGEVRVSLRSTESFYKKTRLHLGRDVATPIGEAIAGIGGGHATAAGVNGRGDISTAKSEALKILRAKIPKTAETTHT
ncbi:MAG: DHH family phosphoesterase [Candidatus Bathyarchaeia archaeon]